DQITVFVIDERSIFIPNVFSPNGDNRNDFFAVYPDSKVAAIRKMQIFDRWGDMVFERNNLTIGREDEGWNGRINNEPAPSATYVYRVEVEYLGGEVEVLVGTVSLL
ncbi:MAG: gliding motility-associated C-terminal domain-containing protein, partial [Bacteroidota bacterium]